ncbi:MFS general substrate transporter [Cylindrobasidium torrendii FP15055 ss-10]|uniref:MFS general substrate transporter n=1 Tax=Cylindrobasidium torrendii FP15055 ss-10 TaxID=1314674 RepID=A0A0D7BPJ6_9AGAR|nr:MFS general substrate transporter [Cylindrobasidium torrendii FP15055 ss-10]
MSRPASRLRPASRSASQSRSQTDALLTDPANMVLSDGTITEQTAELLHEFVHPHQHTEDTLVAEGPYEDEDAAVDAELKARAKLPWWKRPSPYWILAMMPVSSISFTSTIAPRIEVYTQLACAYHRPEIFELQDQSSVRTNGLLAPSHPTLDTERYHNATTTVFFEPISEIAQAVPPTCATDPVVHAAVTKLSAVMTVTMGVLGCLTTAWWGSLSDRIGRTGVLGISVIGLLLTDVVFLLVYSYHQVLPGGYWFLLVGPIVEGTMGGLTSAIAAMHAYIADCTTPASRSRIFSLNLGLMFTGTALGPTIGGLLIHATGNILSVFYMSTITHCFYAVMVWCIIPESLTDAQRNRSRLQYARDKALAMGQGKVKVWMSRALGFLTPLSVIMPLSVQSGNPLKSKGRDWNLTLLAASYGLVVSLIGVVTYKLQYAQLVFGWTPEEMGYWISAVGATRAISLALLLPVFIRVFKPKSPPKDTRREREPLLSPTASRFPSEDEDGSEQDSMRSFHFASHTSAFDLNLARGSLCLEILAYALMGLVNHSLPFTGASMISSLAAGFGPSIQSVALELYNERGGVETGKLFGSLSVLQALCSQIIGPALYGWIFLSTVSTLPSLMFFACAAMLLTAFVLLMMIRLPHPERHPAYDAEEPQHTLEATVVAVEDSDTDTPRLPKLQRKNGNL